MTKELGRVVDPGSLDDSPGSRGRVRIAVPEEWADEGATVTFTAPLRITCARCDGGGCDSCGRSGALKTPGDVTRRLRVHIPSGKRRPFVIRLVSPFGEDAGIDQLLVEITLGDASPIDVSRVDPPPSARPRMTPRTVALGIALAILVAGVFELALHH